MINRNEYYGKIIIPETQDNQIPTNNEQENCGETNDSFLFHVQGATNRNQNSVWPDGKPEQQPKILILSGIPLSKNQRKLLNKGLTFALTPKPNMPVNKKRYRRFHKKTKAKKVFFCKWKR